MWYCIIYLEGFYSEVFSTAGFYRGFFLLEAFSVYLTISMYSKCLVRLAFCPPYPIKWPAFCPPLQFWLAFCPLVLCPPVFCPHTYMICPTTKCPNEISIPAIAHATTHTPLSFICLFGVLHRFQHCTGHITMGSWKGRGNQYIQFIRVL